MATKVTIDPITRLEGHGKIDIFLNDQGGVDKAYLQIPELRGFEQFAVGRHVEDMPQITSRICGVCPMAHHMAATKALDDLFKVEAPPAGRKIREIIYNMFTIEDHALHFYYLGGPDFIVGPKAPKADRNIVGVLGVVGLEIGKEVIGMRRQIRDLITKIAGKIIHPVFGLPGGVSRRVSKEEQQELIAAGEHAIEFGKFSLKAFDDLVLSRPDYVELITSDAYTHKTYYMGMVDKNNHVNFYDGDIRVVDPDGKEFVRFDNHKYLDHIREHVEPWSFMKFTYLKNVGWKGFVDGKDSGIFAVAPLARLNASDGMATPVAQEAYEKMYATLGGKPVHMTLANHWARLIELTSAAEMMLALAKDDEITSDNFRTIPTETPKEGIGVVEAPRGTLFHHYFTDERGVVTRANLIVATQNNAARMTMSVDKAAQSVIKDIIDGKVDDGLMNMVEMGFRAYDPCNGCATHCAPGQVPLRIHVYNSDKELLRVVSRDSRGITQE